jgi:osmotically-inducible protein OsmY
MTKGVSVKKDQLQADVNEELFWEPKVDSAEIAVYVSDGTVTLRGTVGSLRQKIEAKRAAQRVHGVQKIVDQLQVKPLPGHKRDNAELRGLVLQALALDNLVPETVDAQVKEGRVTLTGTAAWHFQRDEAEHVTNNVLGVLGLRDEIVLTGPPPDTGKVGDSIQAAMRRNAVVNADRIEVTSSNGTVTLRGRVDSWPAHDAAVAAAWAAPGVHRVEDEIEILYITS